MPIHHALVFVLLLLPNTSLRDWQTNAGPNLLYVMQHGAISVMNARTAERDTITTRGAIRTIAAGARMGASSNMTLPYKADDYNLEASLANRNVEMLDDASPPMDNTEWPFTDRGESIFVLERFNRLADAEPAIGQWMREPGCRLMVVSPNPSVAAYASDDRLCPVALYGDGVAHGLLISQSTHTPGLIVNTDIAPTIAAYFGATLRTPAFGSPILVHPSSGETILSLLNQDVGYLFQARLIRLMPYVAGCLAAILAILSWRLLRDRRSAATFAAIVIAIPSAMLVTNFRPASLYLVLGAYIAARFSRRPLFWALAVGITLFVLLDAFAFQGHLTGASMLGYTPSEGARYYGVGNEVMGLWIGATTLICCRMADMPKWRPWSLVLAVAVIAALGLPGAGAKAGGFLVGLITLGSALWTRSERVIRPAAALVGVVGIVVLGIITLVLLGRFFGASHVTQTIGLAQNQGFGAISSVIGRKAAMDAHLVFHSVWMIVLIVACTATILAVRPIWRSTNLPRMEIVALITATAASLLLNDAGVVAAALCSLTLWSSAMLLAQQDRSADPTHDAQVG